MLGMYPPLRTAANHPMLRGASELGQSGTKALQFNKHIHDYGNRKCNNLSLIVERNVRPLLFLPLFNRVRGR